MAKLPLPSADPRPCLWTTGTAPGAIPLKRTHPSGLCDFTGAHKSCHRQGVPAGALAPIGQ